MPALQIADLNNAKEDVDHIADVANSEELTATDRLGRTKDTLEGKLTAFDTSLSGRQTAWDNSLSTRQTTWDASLATKEGEFDAVVAASETAAAEQRSDIQTSADAVLAGIGYAPPVAYTAGIDLTTVTQTVSYDGAVYAPTAASLPFTTSGTFETASFRLVQGVAGADLSASTGSAMVGHIADGAGSVLRTLQDKSREFYSTRDKGAAVNDSTDDAADIQAAVDDVTGKTTIDFGNGVHRVKPTGTSPYFLGNQASSLVYRAVALTESNISLRGGRVHVVSRSGVASADIQPAFATDKNMTVGTVENMDVERLEINVENDADGTNSQQRGFYFVGVRGLRLTDTRGISTGTRRGYYAHLQNCENVQITGHYHRKVTGGFNFRYCTGVVLANCVFDDFSEAIDFDGTSSNAVLSNLVFRSSARTNQCIDINGQVGLKASNITVSNVGNIATIQYKNTTPPTYAEYVQHTAWRASTAYLVGDRVINGTNVYECVTSGTSAASGGPTGTSTAIADGTAAWDYVAAPFDMVPSRDVTLRGVRGSEIGSASVGCFTIGNDWSGGAHEGYDPVEDIILEDVQLEDTGAVRIDEGRRLVLRDFHLKDVLVTSGFAAIDARSFASSDAQFEWSDLTILLERVHVERSDRGGVRLAVARRAVINGLRVRESNQSGSSEHDLRINSMETRGAEIFIDGLDLDGKVAIGGNTAGIPTWAISTVYAKNEIVKNGSNYYRCTVGGTSAGAGGPTGTAAAITDNTVTWEWMERPFSVTWGPNNKVRGALELSGDVHKYMFGRTVRVPVGDLAATGTVSKQLFVATRRCYVPRVTYTAGAAVSADASNYRVLTVRSIQAGAAATIVAQATTQAAWAAYTEVDGVFSVSEAGALLNPGDSMYLDATSVLTGKAITDLVALVEVLDM